MIGKVYYCLHKVNKKKVLNVIIDTEFIPRRSAMLNNYKILHERDGTVSEHEIFQKMNLTRRFMSYSYISLKGLLEDEKLFCSKEEIAFLTKICEPIFKKLLPFHRKNKSNNITPHISF